ncbi:hypothetical protein ACWD4G_31050 [Streptomyces sp. NPDC002643]
MPWRWWWGAVTAALVLTTGCGAVEGRRTAAEDAALTFERALGARDGAALCAVLAPGVREEVEQSAGAACAEGVLTEEIPSAVPGGVTGTDGAEQVDVSGRQARVVFAADTLFLSQFSTGWKVVAAGCAPRPGQPYQCVLKGG